MSADTTTRRLRTRPLPTTLLLAGALLLRVDAGVAQIPQPDPNATPSAVGAGQVGPDSIVGPDAADADSTGAADPTEAYAYIGYLAESFADTPAGLGLLPTALAEAETAELQGQLAAEDSVSLVGIQRHATYALHALDPAIAASGPGRGYGVRRALPQIVEFAESARSSTGASDVLRWHAHHVATAARSAQAHLDEAVEVARRIQTARSLQEGMRLARDLARLTRAVASGIDADGDGRISWRTGEGGLDQATWHMNLLKNAEGLY